MTKKSNTVIVIDLPDPFLCTEFKCWIIILWFYLFIIVMLVVIGNCIYRMYHPDLQTVNSIFYPTPPSTSSKPQPAAQNPQFCQEESPQDE
jgi:hypothetical protein